ncbi:MAG: nucleotidyltransferase family protein [Nitriliruptorales bacterium]|nr:nucleotidyltransferase family protein [Nitriliruptorales bacterium]
MAGLVLAAGAGQRFGDATKQLALLDGKPLVRHVVDAALAAGLDQVVVVVGHDAGSVAAALPDLPGVEVVRNEQYRAGQAASVRAGIGALAADVEAVVVLLADQPGVSPSAVRRVRAAVEDGAEVARARYDDGPAHPVGLAREVFARLLALSGDRGARAIFDEVDVIEVDVDGSRPPDVDTPADLARLGGSEARDDRLGHGRDDDRQQ